jgi:predicted nucleic acid-binding protein
VILVDSSVWIDFFNGTSTPQVDKLDSLLGATPLAVGDLILAEVLQGVRNERQFKQVLNTLEAFVLIELGGKEIAIQAAKHYRTLRNLGITPRKIIDTIIATRCIVSRLTLLHADRDFDVFATHLGLKVVPAVP